MMHVGLLVLFYRWGGRILLMVRPATCRRHEKFKGGHASLKNFESLSNAISCFNLRANFTEILNYYIYYIELFIRRIIGVTKVALVVPVPSCQIEDENEQHIPPPINN